jgi:DNA repair ATPase RecN
MPRHEDHTPLERIAMALEIMAHRLIIEPEWAARMEAQMADLATAIANLQAADQSVVDELAKLATEVRNMPDVSAAADAIQAEADKLAQAVTDAEAPPA